MDSESKFAILVISSDFYADIWPVFFQNFQTNWRDCEFPVYLGVNTREYQHESLTQVVKSGNDEDWSSSFLNILDNISEEYLFVILEDFIITSKVDNNEVHNHFKFMEKNLVNHMHFANLGLPFDKILNSDYGIYEKGAPYRVNVFGFWNKYCLKGLLQPGESAWNFEIMGSYRSTAWTNFLAIIKTPFKIINLLKKGTYMPASLKECDALKIQVPHNSRQVLISEKYFKYYAREVYFKYITKVNWRYRQKLMNILRKILVCY